MLHRKLKRVMEEQTRHRFGFVLILVVASILLSGVALVLVRQVSENHALQAKRTNRMGKGADYGASGDAQSSRKAMISATFDDPGVDVDAPTDSEKNICNSHGKVGLLIWNLRASGLSKQRALDAARGFLDQDALELSQVNRSVEEVYEGSAANFNAESTTELFYAECLTNVITNRIDDAKRRARVN